MEAPTCTKWNHKQIFALDIQSGVGEEVFQLGGTGICVILWSQWSNEQRPSFILPRIWGVKVTQTCPNKGIIP